MLVGEDYLIEVHIIIETHVYLKTLGDTAQDWLQ